MKLTTVTNNRWVFESTPPDAPAHQYTGVQGQIATWLQQHQITDFSINADNTVDVSGDVTFLAPRFKKLPFQFGRIGGSLSITGGSLRSSWGFPKVLEGSLHWTDSSSFNADIDLSYLPTQIKGDVVFDWWGVQFTNSSLRQVGGSFIIQHGRLQSFEGLPETVGGSLVIQNDGENVMAESLAGLPKRIGSGHLTLRCLQNITELRDIPEGVTHLNLYSAGEFYAPIKVTQSLKNVEHIDFTRFGVLVDGLNNLPDPFNGVMKVGGTSLEGIPTTINGILAIVTNTDEQITKKMHKHLNVVNGTLRIMMIETQSNVPLLSVLKLKGIKKFETYGCGSPEVATIINNALHNPDADIFEVQAAMIDSGYNGFAKL